MNFKESYPVKNFSKRVNHIFSRRDTVPVSEGLTFLPVISEIFSSVWLNYNDVNTFDFTLDEGYKSMHKPIKSQISNFHMNIFFHNSMSTKVYTEQSKTLSYTQETFKHIQLCFHFQIHYKHPMNIHIFSPLPLFGLCVVAWIFSQCHPIPVVHTITWCNMQIR